MTKHLNKIAEAAVFNSRWILYPMSIGLIIALTMYSLKFIVECYMLISMGFHIESEQMVVLILGLVDMFMVANLMVMITQGSYQIFIKRFNFVDAAQRPQWLDHVDSSILKVKIGTSIFGITIVRLLKDFINIENVPWEAVVHRMYISGLCLVSSFVLAGIWRLLHVPENGNEHK